MRVVTTALVAFALVLAGGCSTTIRFDLLRPARVTPPGPGTPYEVVGFELPAMQPQVPASPAFAQAQPQPSPTGAVVVLPVPAPVAAVMGGMRQPLDTEPYEVLRLDASGQLAQRLSDTLALAIRTSPSPNQILVPTGGRVRVGGQVLEASYIETEHPREGRCDREVADRAGRSRTQRVPCIETVRQASVTMRLRMRVWTTDRVLFDEVLTDSSSAELVGRAALDGTWSEPAQALEPQAVLDTAAYRLIETAQRVVVPWSEPADTSWLDASGYPEHDEAREHAGEGRFEESLALLDTMLGTTGRLSPRSTDQARLLANRSVLRLAMGRYSEALIDMDEAERLLPGCVARHLVQRTRTIVAEQDAVRAQGMTQTLGARPVE